MACLQVAVCNADVLIPVLLSVSCHCPDTTSSQLSAQAYAVILNKMEEGNRGTKT